MSAAAPKGSRAGLVLGAGLAVLALLLLLVRFAAVTDRLYHAAVKDPERTAPPGPVFVAPADGRILYVRDVRGGTIPQVVKRGVSVPLRDHLKTSDGRRFPDGVLIGIYMNSESVHVNRAPIAGEVAEQIIFNGPHMDMGPAERTIILTQLLPGLVGLKKLLGLEPYGIEEEGDYVLKSARETLRFRDSRGGDVYVVRIADYSVGKILTWVGEGERVETGQRIGMITWGSQTDVFIEAGDGIEVETEVGDFVYAGESILARY